MSIDCSRCNRNLLHSQRSKNRKVLHYGKCTSMQLENSLKHAYFFGNELCKFFATVHAVFYGVFHTQLILKLGSQIRMRLIKFQNLIRNLLKLVKTFAKFLEQKLFLRICSDSWLWQLLIFMQNTVISGFASDLYSQKVSESSLSLCLCIQCCFLGLQQFLSINFPQNFLLFFQVLLRDNHFWGFLIQSTSSTVVNHVRMLHVFDVWLQALDFISDFVFRFQNVIR